MNSKGSEIVRLAPSRRDARDDTTSRPRYMTSKWTFFGRARRRAGTFAGVFGYGGRGSLVPACPLVCLFAHGASSPCRVRACTITQPHAQGACMHDCTAARAGCVHARLHVLMRIRMPRHAGAMHAHGYHEYKLRMHPALACMHACADRLSIPAPGFPT
eukprot:233650-Chlamydomonas_euryale.AAC.4